MSQRERGGDQGETSLEAEDRGPGERGMAAAELRHRHREQGEPGGAEKECEPLSSLDRGAEQPLRHHRQGHRAARKDPLHQ